MEKKLKEIKEMYTVPDSVLATLQKDIAEIKTALLGNEYNPAGGLLCRTTELEKEFEKLKLRYEKTMAYATGIAAAVSVVLTFLGDFVFNAIFK